MVAASALDAPMALGQAVWLPAAIAWLWTIAVHVRRGRRTDHRVAQQLTHVAHGPLAALLPIAAMVLGAGLYRMSPPVGTVLTLSAIATAAAFGVWILSYWMRGELSLDSVHGGYYLPISAAGLVGALASGEIGVHWLAVGTFAVGVFFWLVISTFFFLRLALHPNLPEPLVPTLAILVAPSAIASAAWLTITGGTPDGIFDRLTAMTVFMVLVQVMLLPRYRARS